MAPTVAAAGRWKIEQTLRSLSFRRLFKAIDHRAIAWTSRVRRLAVISNSMQKPSPQTRDKAKPMNMFHSSWIGSEVISEPGMQSAQEHQRKDPGQCFPVGVLDRTLGIGRH
jgi:hypothetical protein